MTGATVSWIIPDKSFPEAYVSGDAFGLVVHADDLAVINIPTTTADKINLASLRRLAKALAKFLEMEVHE